MLLRAFLLSTALALAACAATPEASQPPSSSVVPASSPPSETGGATSAATTASPLGPQLSIAWRTDDTALRFALPDGVAVGPEGDVYVMESGKGLVRKLDREGSLIDTWGGPGTLDGQFDCTTKCMIAVDRQGNVFVTDNDNARIQKFDAGGKFLSKWGTPGTADGQFRGPFGIAVDGTGNVYVGDVGNGRVQEFDNRGRFLAKWGSRGSGEGQFSNALADLAVDSAGDVYVTDRTNGLQKFDRAGRFLARADRCGDDRPLSSATGVAVDTRDNVFVFDRSRARLCEFTANGGFVAQWDRPAADAPRFASVGGVAVDGAGGIYLAELFDGVVLKLQQP